MRMPVPVPSIGQWDQIGLLLSSVSMANHIGQKAILITTIV